MSLNKGIKKVWGQGATIRLDQYKDELASESTEVVSQLDRLIKNTKDLVKQIANQEKGIARSKQEVLYNIYRIYTEHVSELERKYQTDIKRFIEDTFETQASKTNFNDAKTIEMLASHSMGQLLQQDIKGMLTSLKSIAFMPGTKNKHEETFFQAQRKLLERLGTEELSPDEVAAEVKGFKRQANPKLKVINEIPKEWEVIAPRTGSKIELKGFQNKQHQKELLQLLQEINSENLDKFLQFSETLKNG